MLLGVSRLMFAWAEDGIFPAAVAAVHPRYRTPHVAILAQRRDGHRWASLGSHLAGDFFLGVDILVTSMLDQLPADGALGADAAGAQSGARRARSRCCRHASQQVPAGGGRRRSCWRCFSPCTPGATSPADAAWYFRSTPVWAIVMAAGDRHLLARDAPRSTAQGVDVRGAVRGAAAGVGPEATHACRSIASTWRRGCPISRVVTGLWQIADMERDGRSARPRRRPPRAMHAVRRGRASPRSTWPTTTARPSSSPAAPARTTARAGSTCSCFTKWVPKPGPVTPPDVRAAVDAVARAAPRAGHRPAAVPRLELRRPVVARRALPPAGPEARRADPSPRPDQRRCRAPAPGRWRAASRSSRTR